MQNSFHSHRNFQRTFRALSIEISLIHILEKQKYRHCREGEERTLLHWQAKNIFMLIYKAHARMVHRMIDVFSCSTKD